MKICIYGASSNDINSVYLKAGYDLGKRMAEENMELVFGGGTTGMMGAVVRGIEEKGGKSIGIAPKFFDHPDILHSCDEFIYTDTMRERKGKMESLADGFIVTPGGIGTLDEFIEIYTLKQLRQLDKPICILNTDGFYKDLLDLFASLVEKKFMSINTYNLIYVSESIEDIIDYLKKECK